MLDEIMLESKKGIADVEENINYDSYTFVVEYEAFSNDSYDYNVQEIGRSLGVSSQILDVVNSRWDHKNYTQTCGDNFPLRRANGVLRNSKQAKSALAKSKFLKGASILSNGVMAWNGIASIFNDGNVTWRNGADAILGTLGVAAGIILLASNPIGWVATATIAVSTVTTVYGTATLGYDIYNDYKNDD